MSTEQDSGADDTLVTSSAAAEAGEQVAADGGFQGKADGAVGHSMLATHSTAAPAGTTMNSWGRSTALDATHSQTWSGGGPTWRSSFEARPDTPMLQGTFDTNRVQIPGLEERIGPGACYPDPSLSNSFSSSYASSEVGTSDAGTNSRLMSARASTARGSRVHLPGVDERIGPGESYPDPSAPVSRLPSSSLGTSGVASGSSPARSQGTSEGSFGFTPRIPITFTIPVCVGMRSETGTVFSVSARSAGISDHRSLASRGSMDILQLDADQLVQQVMARQERLYTPSRMSTPALSSVPDSLDTEREKRKAEGVAEWDSAAAPPAKQPTTSDVASVTVDAEPPPEPPAKRPSVPDEVVAHADKEPPRELPAMPTDAPTPAETAASEAAPLHPLPKPFDLAAPAEALADEEPPIYPPALPADVPAPAEAAASEEPPLEARARPKDAPAPAEAAASETLPSAFSAEGDDELAPAEAAASEAPPMEAQAKLRDAPAPADAAASEILPLDSPSKLGDPPVPVDAAASEVLPLAIHSKPGDAPAPAEVAASEVPPLEARAAPVHAPAPAEAAASDVVSLDFAPVPGDAPAPAEAAASEVEPFDIPAKHAESHQVEETADVEAEQPSLPADEQAGDEAEQAAAKQPQEILAPDLDPVAGGEAQLEKPTAVDEAAFVEAAGDEDLLKDTASSIATDDLMQLRRRPSQDSMQSILGENFAVAHIERDVRIFSSPSPRPGTVSPGPLDSARSKSSMTDSVRSQDSRHGRFAEVVGHGLVDQFVAEALGDDTFAFADAAYLLDRAAEDRPAKVELRQPQDSQSQRTVQALKARGPLWQRPPTPAFAALSARSPSGSGRASLAPKVRSARSVCESIPENETVAESFSSQQIIEDIWEDHSELGAKRLAVDAIAAPSREDQTFVGKAAAPPQLPLLRAKEVEGEIDIESVDDVATLASAEEKMVDAVWLWDGSRPPSAGDSQPPSTPGLQVWSSRTEATWEERLVDAVWDWPSEKGPPDKPVEEVAAEAFDEEPAKAVAAERPMDAIPLESVAQEFVIEKLGQEAPDVKLAEESLKAGRPESVRDYEEDLMTTPASSVVNVDLGPVIKDAMLDYQEPMSIACSEVSSDVVLPPVVVKEPSEGHAIEDVIWPESPISAAALSLLKVEQPPEEIASEVLSPETPAASIAVPALEIKESSDEGLDEIVEEVISPGQQEVALTDFDVKEPSEVEEEVVLWPETPAVSFVPTLEVKQVPEEPVEEVLCRETPAPSLAPVFEAKEPSEEVASEVLCPETPAAPLPALEVLEPSEEEAEEVLCSETPAAPSLPAFQLELAPPSPPPRDRPHDGDDDAAKAAFLVPPEMHSKDDGGSEAPPPLPAARAFNGDVPGTPESPSARKHVPSDHHDQDERGSEAPPVLPAPRAFERDLPGTPESPSARKHVPSDHDDKDDHGSEAPPPVPAGAPRAPDGELPGTPDLPSARKHAPSDHFEKDSHGSEAGLSDLPPALPPDLPEKPDLQDEEDAKLAPPPEEPPADDTDGPPMFEERMLVELMDECDAVVPELPITIAMPPMPPIPAEELQPFAPIPAVKMEVLENLEEKEYMPMEEPVHELPAPLESFPKDKLPLPPAVQPPVEEYEIVAVPFAPEEELAIPQPSFPPKVRQPLFTPPPPLIRRTEPAPLKYLPDVKTQEEKMQTEATRALRQVYHRVLSPPPVYKEYLPCERAAMECDIEAWTHVMDRHEEVEVKQSLEHRKHFDKELADKRKRRQRIAYKTAPGDLKGLSEKKARPALSPVVSQKAAAVAQQILTFADNHAKNGELTVVELEANLSKGSLGEKFRGFLEWMTENRGARFKRWDGNRDGAIQVAELKGAVADWLGEAPARPTKSGGRLHSADKLTASAPDLLSPSRPSSRHATLTSRPPSKVMPSPGLNSRPPSKATALLAEMDKSQHDRTTTKGSSRVPGSKSMPLLPPVQPYSAKGSNTQAQITAAAALQLIGGKKIRGRARPGIDFPMPEGKDLLKLLAKGVTPSALVAPI